MPEAISSVSLRETECGTGVFAEQRFVIEELVGEIFGKMIDDGNYESAYCMEIDDTKKLEPVAPYRFLNHSCEPNCELVIFEDEDPHQLWLQVIQPIEPGDELTIDYAWPADVAIPCLCGKIKCRGWVVDANELSLVAHESAV